MTGPMTTQAPGQLASGLVPACIVCREGRIEEFLDLGETALANEFIAAEDLEGHDPSYDLRVGFCHGCGHVQLTTPVPPDRMFRTYLYQSSAS